MVSPVTREPIHALIDPSPHDDHLAAPLVAEAHRVARVTLIEIGHLTGEELDVGAAHADTGDVDDDLAGTGCGCRDVLHRTAARTMHDEGTHRHRLVTAPSRPRGVGGRSGDGDLDDHRMAQ